MANPLFKADSFVVGAAAQETEAMTLDGVLNRTTALLCLCVAGAAFIWTQPQWAGLALPASLLGLVAAIATIWRKPIAPYSAPVYAVLEGIALGGISVAFNQSFPGIVFQAMGLTFAVLACMLFVYKTGIVQVTPNLRAGILIATGAIMVVYIVDLVASFFDHSVVYIHQTGPIGILFSLLVVGVAAFNLLIDFDFIENGIQGRSPKYMEWYAGFSLLVTLVWLYLEILRLLSKMRRR